VEALLRLRQSIGRAARARRNRRRFFGLDNVDKRLLPHIRKRRGTFVELGAFDGVNQSNTAWLEANRGWRGILIEPIPEAYEQCVRNRPLATVVNCACVSNKYSEPTVEMVYAGLMSIVRGARSSDETDEAWISLGEELQHVSRYTCVVPARTLTAVLDEYDFQRIDLLSLDVEGYEMEVLQGFDLDRFRPRHVLVEESRPDGIGRYLTTRGYRKVTEVARGRLTADVLYERAGDSRRGIEGFRRPLGEWKSLAGAVARRVLRVTRNGASSRHE
jgi:FkbM family methyltransferase